MAKISGRRSGELVVETGPTATRRSVEKSDLLKDRWRELAEVLECVSLESMIGACKAVKDRIDFLKGLELLVFHPASKDQLVERQQLHRILATQTWVFGQQFDLTVDDKGLTKVLQAHLELLGQETTDVIPVREEDGSVGIVDLMLSRAIPQQANRREHLVVELKAPKVVLTADHTNQIENYAQAVASDAQFRDTNTEWTFILVGNDYNDVVRRKITQRGREKGLLSEPVDQHAVRYTIWVRTWSQIIEDCRWQMKLFQDQLRYVADEAAAIKYLRTTHGKFLPPVFAKRAPRRRRNQSPGS